MFKIQTIPFECPKRSKVGYELSIELIDFSADAHEVFIVGPDGQGVPHRISDGCVRIEHRDGPGVARFQAVVRNKPEVLEEGGGSRVPVLKPSEARDVLTIEVLVLPETEPSIRDAVEAIVSSMSIGIKGGSMTVTAPDLGVEGFRLQKSFGEAAPAEVLRRLALDRGDATSVLRCLYLLFDLAGRFPLVPWLAPSIFAVLGDLVGSLSSSFMLKQVLDAFERIALAPKDQWLYLIRTLQEQQLERSRTIGLLRRVTPREYRLQTAAIVLEVCGVVADGRGEACNLFNDFSYRQAAEEVLEWMEVDRYVISEGCQFLRAIDYRSALPRLRTLLDQPGDRPGDEEIVKCLASWQDHPSIAMMVKKIAETSDYTAGSMVKHLLRIGAEVIPAIQEVQRKSGPAKAKSIADSLASHAPSAKA